MPILAIDSLTLAIQDKLLVKNLTVNIDEGQRWGLLGKNGVGKTTLLHSILGIFTPNAGEVKFQGENISDISRQELAKNLGILFQQGISTLPATVMETVLLGRHPHVQTLLRDDPQDLAIALDALKELGLEELIHRQVDSLSGGERQRLALAMLFAQMPTFFLLDEPNNHLDIAYQVKFLEALNDRLNQPIKNHASKVTSARKASLLIATHDINLASRFCDNIILMMGNGEWISGTNIEVLSSANLSRSYDCAIEMIESGTNRWFYPR
jgi:iron complex transport system ATP-binding protein